MEQPATRGRKIFVDELRRFAEKIGDPRVRAVAERAGAPLRVAVRGRPGTGGATVRRALNSAPGIAVADPADVAVYVTVEVLKPEDRAMIAAHPPALILLNKADLTGFGGAGPMMAAQARAAQLSAVAGVPVLPVSALLAVAARDLDPARWAALQALADAGWACLDESHDGFLSASLPVSVEARRTLLEKLDLFGVALGIAAARRHGSLSGFRALLRRVSGVDEVVAALRTAGANVRYQRVLQATAELAAIAVGNDAVSEFLSCDDTVLARMAAAEDVLRASGLDTGPVGHLERAQRWHRYSDGPQVHRACAADLVRGSLRLWSQAGGIPQRAEAR
ncbi:hypothetical protein [Mycobacterium kubicae]|uniref:hypothetical protein n=1 Tax=Mycobacterium kubicae TaxID=120959 RepID=UPI000A15D966|nr:hypothetical protein [Mycobacterium kubicae]ORW06045.1 hypothetical protein AWC13_24120 [Mycobacterium kubicae]QNI10245.1 hypothetical protein GAN18_02545 [Mycobacterium kubicae]